MTNIIKDEFVKVQKFDTGVLKGGTFVKITNKFLKGKGRVRFGIVTSSTPTLLTVQVVQTTQVLNLPIEDYLEPLVNPYSIEASTMQEMFEFVEPEEEAVEEVEEPVVEESEEA